MQILKGTESDNVSINFFLHANSFFILPFFLRLFFVSLKLVNSSFNFDILM